VSADEGLSVTDETVETIDTEAPAAEPAPVAVATVETPAPAVEATTKVPTRSRRAGQPIQTVGRRKEAIVRVRLVPGTGKFLLNGRELENYFPSKVQQQTVKEPLVIVEKVDQFDVFANLRGGGTTGQAGGLRLAIARALIENDPDDRPALKKAGFLTRDARATERKKYGLKKARKAPQYSKR
jgi:small subunit ribosomal protein S9